MEAGIGKEEREERRDMEGGGEGEGKDTRAGERGRGGI